MSRALAAAGWTVGVATTRRRGLADSSRSASMHHRVPPPGKDLDGFIAAIAEAIEEGGYEVVLPGAGDGALMGLSLRRGELPATLPLPAHRRVMEVADKLSLAKASERAGLGAPRTIRAGDLERDDFGFPAVVKERLHADPERMHDRVEARIVGSREEAEAQAEVIRAAGGEPLLQERLRGQLAAFSLVASREGEVVAAVQQLSERTWPPSAGVSARARTVEVDALLRERVQGLVRDLAWFGIAELQFVDSGSDGLKLIDFNGRGYGSLALAVAAGVNLPAIWAAVAGSGRPDSSVAVPGVRYQWLEADLRCALTGGAGRLRRLWDCLRYARGAAHSVWSRRDPRPAGRYLRIRAATVLRSALPFAGAGRGERRTAEHGYIPEE
jgi:predicted ATP-grasp superfamily ATP-dependent carboligase